MNSKPHPQNEILVPFRGVFENFRQAPVIFIEEYPPVREEGGGYCLYSAENNLKRKRIRMSLASLSCN